MVGELSATDVVIARWRCGSWLCKQGCGDKVGARWLARAFAGVEALGETRMKFLTLTFDQRALVTKEAAWERLGPAWHRLHVALKRDYGHFDYFRVVELHKSGWPHVHVLLGIDDYIPHEHLRLRAVAAGFGRVVDIRQAWKARQEAGTVHERPLEGENATRRAVARYVTKYLVKARAQLPKGKRRVCCTRTWGDGVWHEPVNDKMPARWHLDERPVGVVVDAYTAAGYNVLTRGDWTDCPEGRD